MLLHADSGLSFAHVRPGKIIYLLPLALCCNLLDLRSAYFLPRLYFFGHEADTIAYGAYAAGTLLVLLFLLKRLRFGIRLLVLLTILGYVSWVVFPEGNMKMASLFLAQFGIGGCSIYGTYVFVFLLNNAERLLSAFLVQFHYGVFIVIWKSGINSPFLSVLFTGLYIGILAFCLLRFRTEEFPDNSAVEFIAPPKALYISIVCGMAYFTLNVFGDEVVKNAAGNDMMRGIGSMLAVLIAAIVLFGFRLSVWYISSFFLILNLLGLLAQLLPANPELHSAGKLLFGIGDSLGYVLTFYVIGWIKKYRNDLLFRKIVLMITGELFLSVIAVVIISHFIPGALSVITASLVLFFLCLFTLFSPIFHRHIFESEWGDDFVKRDMAYIEEKVDEINQLENFSLSPREMEVSAFLLRGLTMRQISATLGIQESTVNGYCKTLYKKLGISSRIEMFARFGVKTDENSPPPLN